MIATVVFYLAKLRKKEPVTDNSWKKKKLAVRQAVQPEGGRPSFNEVAKHLHNQLLP